MILSVLQSRISTKEHFQAIKMQQPFLIYASTCTVASLLSDSYKVKHCCSLSREDQQVMEEGVCLVMSASSATSSSLGSLTDR